jgi:hypothetical protein
MITIAVLIAAFPHWLADAHGCPALAGTVSGGIRDEWVWIY